MGFKIENIQTATATKKETQKVSIWKREIALFGAVFNNKVKEEFYTELGVLLNAGIQLKQALDLIGTSFKKESHKRIVHDIVASIVLGKSFSNAIQPIKSFTEYEYYSIQIGEETGTLHQVAQQLADFYTRKNNQRRQLIGALIYPCIILSTAVLVVLFMLQFVVPMFQDIFEQQDLELPWITNFIIEVSEIVGAYGFWILVLLVGLLFFNKFLLKQVWYKKFMHNALLRIPYIGALIKTIYLSQFTQAFSLLTIAKVPFVNSINLVKKMIDFHPLKEALDAIEKEVMRGTSISKSMSSHKIFSSKMIAMVGVAEETNQNEYVFKKLNEQFNVEVEHKSKLLSTVLEPVIIVIIGLIVGVILISMYLPMFQLSSVLG
ncbi:type II secretion system F family protein [Nonlabens agnitus]|uniref:General secretion pathway protein F n=1 Tax=Nonlabens agnitus TaxID=870484 RepID=A0A2S9WQZ0_9FLAO|nr:type II secretion system F family protein [Nonlabens agnitus]PRP65881.1 general secretion pathway protein GspF [Nonlabens agnitus]